MLSKTMILALALGVAPTVFAQQRDLRAFIDGNGAATQCSGGSFDCTIDRGRCCFMGGSVISGGFIINSQFSDFVTLQVRTEFDPDSGCGSSTAEGTGSMCISAGIDGANAIRWEEGNNRVARRATVSAAQAEDKVRPHTFNFVDGASMNVTGMNDEELVELVSFARSGGNAKSLPSAFAGRLK